MTSEVKKHDATVELAKQAPLLVVFALFACGFLYFMERRDNHWMRMLERDDKVSALRIDQCHMVQSESSAALVSFAEALQVHALAFKEVSIRLENLR